jgi:hypothetical protein
MLQQGRLRAPRQTGNALSVRVVVFLQEKLHEQRDVFESLGQRREAKKTVPGKRRRGWSVRI